jgi:hypothetical protein
MSYLEAVAFVRAEGGGAGGKAAEALESLIPSTWYG